VSRPPGTLDPRVRTVQAGYDELAQRFGEWGERIEGDPWRRFLDDLAARLPDGGRVLDLGCGNGRKLGRLAGRFQLTGVDVSQQQLRLARAEVPGASFVEGDFAQLDFPDASFDAVVALYSITHVPREEHPALLGRIAGWLRPGGLFLASLSHVGGEDWTSEWLGVEMFFSGYDAQTNRRLVREAGFEVLADELVWMREPEAEVGFLWVLARKPS
jgi:SAM-dependent methyltransferase